MSPAASTLAITFCFRIGHRVNNLPVALRAFSKPSKYIQISSLVYASVSETIFFKNYSKWYELYKTWAIFVPSSVASSSADRINEWEFVQNFTDGTLLKDRSFGFFYKNTSFYYMRALLSYSPHALCWTLYPIIFIRGPLYSVNRSSLLLVITIIRRK